VSLRIARQATRCLIRHATRQYDSVRKANCQHGELDSRGIWVDVDTDELVLICNPVWNEFPLHAATHTDIDDARARLDW
jgi:hypothetical protein